MSKLPSQSSISQEISLRHHRALLDRRGAAYFPDLDLLVVSDLHFEKGTSFARKGVLIPPYDSRATLASLEALVSTYRPATVISLGDAFHDPEAERRMALEDAARLQAICTATDWIWVLGNHDPYPPKRFAGSAFATIEISGLLFVHEPGEADGWAMAGHLHPCAAVSKQGCRLRTPCFIEDGERMIMPAFGAFTGGLNVLDTAFAPHFSGVPSVHVLGKTRSFQVPRDALRPDNSSWMTDQRRSA